MCALCTTTRAVDPWTTCADCVVTLPAVFRPPALSPLGVRACLELRQEVLTGEYAARRELYDDLDPPEIPDEPANPWLTGVPVPGVGVVAIPDRGRVASSRRGRTARRRRWQR